MEQPRARLAPPCPHLVLKGAVSAPETAQRPASPAARAAANSTGSTRIRLRTRSGRSSATRRQTVPPKEWPIRSTGPPPPTRSANSIASRVVSLCRSVLPVPRPALPCPGWSKRRQFHARQLLAPAPTRPRHGPACNAAPRPAARFPRPRPDTGPASSAGLQASTAFRTDAGRGRPAGPAPRTARPPRHRTARRRRRAPRPLPDCAT